MTERGKRFIGKEEKKKRRESAGRDRRERESMTLRGKIYQVLNLTGIKYSKRDGIEEDKRIRINQTKTENQKCLTHGVC